MGCCPGDVGLEWVVWRVPSTCGCDGHFYAMPFLSTWAAVVRASWCFCGWVGAFAPSTQRSWCSRWKLRAKGQLLSWPWALTSRVMDMFYINSPSDGAVLEAKIRIVPLSHCLSPGSGQRAIASCSRYQGIFNYLSVRLYLQGEITRSQITANSLVALVLSWEVQDAAFIFFMQKNRNWAQTTGCCVSVGLTVTAPCKKPGLQKENQGLLCCGRGYCNNLGHVQKLSACWCFRQGVKVLPRVSEQGSKGFQGRSLGVKCTKWEQSTGPMDSGMPLACWEAQPGLLSHASNTDLPCLTCGITLVLFLGMFFQCSQSALLCSKRPQQQESAF